MLPFVAGDAGSGQKRYNGLDVLCLELVSPTNADLDAAAAAQGTPGARRFLPIFPIKGHPYNPIHLRLEPYCTRSHLPDPSSTS
ncbi:uncharacterized protein DNG_02236 [Cephalotrichum gorgonifer]|uniref:Uncharacterized protein n=1 Tax=Cephalotrichum gorgonifer TaxID=2041049 RepID=A0AAE8MSY9_9PEZI|nr:uncharacterized protein DNG_02236 [Cephalotrichum gorgonifer]